jgi:hypothetical protein
MKVILTETQYNRLIESDSEWNSEKLYDREKVVEALRRGPKYIREYIKKLPRIPMENEKGEVKIATRIPQTIHQFLFGNF